MQITLLENKYRGQDVYIYIYQEGRGKLLWARVNYIARLPSFLSSFMETGGARNTPLPEHNEGLIR